MINNLLWRVSSLHIALLLILHWGGRRRCWERLGLLGSLFAVTYLHALSLLLWSRGRCRRFSTALVGRFRLLLLLAEHLLFGDALLSFGFRVVIVIATRSSPLLTSLVFGLRF